MFTNLRCIVCNTDVSYDTQVHHGNILDALFEANINHMDQVFVNQDSTDEDNFDMDGLVVTCPNHFFDELRKLDR